MKQKFIKVKNEDGSVHYERTRFLVPYNLEPNKYVFKDTKGKVFEPTDTELELYNEDLTGGIKINNGWLTFLGILSLFNLIALLIIIVKFAR